MAHPDHPEYRGTFDPIHDTLAATPHPRDPTQVAQVTTSVEAMLASRPREELDGTGALRKDLAHERITGSLQDLRLLRLRAVKADALPEFIELIDTVIAEAEAARAAAPRRAAQAVEAGRRPAGWATAEVDDGYQTLPDFLRDI